MPLNDEEIDVVSIEATIDCALKDAVAEIAAEADTQVSCDVSSMLSDDLRATLEATTAANVEVDIGDHGGAIVIDSQMSSESPNPVQNKVIKSYVLLVAQATLDTSKGYTDSKCVSFATQDWVNAQGFIKEHQSLDGYATQLWVNEQGFMKSFTETDPTVPSHVKSITQEDISAWDNKSDFSGSYNDLTDKPTIPSLDGYATEQWVESKNYLTEHQSLAGYATEQWVLDKHYLTEHQSLDNYVTLDSDQTIEGQKTFTERPIVGKNALPPQYQRVEYIQGSKYSWFDTGINANTENIEIDVKFSDVEETNNTALIGTADSWSNSPMIGYYQGIYLWADSSTSYRGFLGNNQEIIRIKVNGTTISFGDNQRNNFDFYSIISGRSYKLFSPAPPNTTRNSAKCHYLIIRQNEKLKFYGIPCRRKSDNKPGMWDTVSKTFFINQGTGADFTLGPDVEVVSEVAAVSDLTEYAKKDELANVATSGSYNDLSDKPTIPSTEGLATEQYVNDHHDSTKQDVINDLATIRSGAEKGASAVQTETDPTVPSHVKSITQQNITDWNAKSTFSGNYNDLTNKPTAKITLTQDQIQSVEPLILLFTDDQMQIIADDGIMNVLIDATILELGYPVFSKIKTFTEGIVDMNATVTFYDTQTKTFMYNAHYCLSCEMSTKLGILVGSIMASSSDIPTKTSQLTNDSGFLTSHQSLADYVKTTDSRLSDARTPTAHTHEMTDVTGLTNALSGKADSSHKHTKDDITDFPSSMPASDVHQWAKEENKPTYTYNEVGAAASDHNHDNAYLGKTAKASDSAKLNGKEASSYVETTDSRLSDARTPTAHTHSTSDITDFSTNVNTLIEEYMTNHYENGNEGSY